jgi:hypothetical protein
MVDETEVEFTEEIDDLFEVPFFSQNTKKDAYRVRLIGESIRKLSPHLSTLVSCLKPVGENGTTWPDEKLESSEEFQNRIVCHTYVHLLRCHSSVLSSWTVAHSRDELGALFMGNLFVLLVDEFHLHKSYNTFLFAQVAPYKIKANLEQFQISETHSLGLGVYGRNEGGEHSQKLIKEHYFKWTDKKSGCFLSLVDQTIEVYIGGTYMFPEMCSAPIVNLKAENNSCWRTRFGDNQSDLNCFACGSVLLANRGQVLRQALETVSVFFNPIIMSCASMYEKLRSTTFDTSARKLVFFFVHFLKFRREKIYCDECVVMFQLLFALQFGLQQDLKW